MKDFLYHLQSFSVTSMVSLEILSGGLKHQQFQIDGEVNSQPFSVFVTVFLGNKIDPRYEFLHSPEPDLEWSAKREFWTQLQKVIFESSDYALFNVLNS